MHRRGPLSTPVAALLVWLAAHAAHAQMLVEGPAISCGGPCGSSVAVSADGSRVVIGGSPSVSPAMAVARIFARSGSAWTLEAVLDVPTGIAPDNDSVAIDATGSTVLLGHPSDFYSSIADAGRVHVYTRTGVTWSLETALNHPSASLAGAAHFGTAVALSADGSRAVISTFRPGAGVASEAWIFARTGGGWSVASSLVPSPALIAAARPSINVTGWYGATVAISADGNTALVADPDANAHSAIEAGLAWVFHFDGTNWVNDAFLDVGATMLSYAGSGLALSADGSRALVGAPLDSQSGTYRAGSAHVFGAVGGVWSHDATLFAASPSAGAYFGQSVAWTSDRIIVGAKNEADPPGEGAVRLLASGPSGWSEVQRIVSGDGDTSFGYAVALSSDGSTAVVGGAVVDHAHVYSLTPAAPVDAGIDGGAGDAGLDAALRDAGLDASTSDAGIDASTSIDASTASDAGTRDGGPDAAAVDGGHPIDAASPRDAASALDAPSAIDADAVSPIGGGSCRVSPGGSPDPRGVVLALIAIAIATYQRRVARRRTGPQVT